MNARSHVTYSTQQAFSGIPPFANAVKKRDPALL